MYLSITNPLFWMFGLLSVIAVLASWYLPGVLFLHRSTIKSKLSLALIAISLGMVLWGVQGYIFGYLQLRWLSYVYLAVIFFLAFKNKKNIIQISSGAFRELIVQPKIILVSLIVACALQLIVIIGSGFSSANGVVFYFNNAADGVMHLSYIQSIINHFPPAEPGASGLALQNYHYWGDLVTAELARVWKLPVIHLFFQYLPVLIILVSMQLAVQLIKLLKGTTLTILLALFFLTFGADLSYIFSYLIHQQFMIDIPILDNGITFLFNMPQVFARLLLITTLSLLIEWTQITKSNVYTLGAIGMLVAAQFGFKVYYGIYAVLGLGFVTLFVLIKDVVILKKGEKAKHFFSVPTAQKQLFMAWILIMLLSAAIYLPTNKNSGGLLFYPFEWPKLLLSSEHLDFTDWWLRLQVYEAAGNYRNIVILYTVAVIITFFIIHGTRLIGLVPSRVTFKQLPKEFLIFVLPTNLIFLTVGMLFFQASGGFNIYNFFLVPTFSFCLLAAFNVSWIKQPVLRYSLVAIIILLTIPRSVTQIAFHLNHYRLATNTTTISNSEIELLNYIKNNSTPNAVVQADPNNGHEYLTPYTSFFTQRNSYYSGVVLLVTHNQHIDDRQEIVKNIFADSNQAAQTKQLMETSMIDYLVITSQQYRDQFEKQLQDTGALKIAFENEAGLIIARE